LFHTDSKAVTWCRIVLFINISGQRGFFKSEKKKKGEFKEKSPVSGEKLPGRDKKSFQNPVCVFAIFLYGV
jgi:hypothetical protein